ncbi:MAG: phosphoenolpyruvate carboxylase [Methanomassiliicoccales archaeon]|nr:phosphoenolpyruvate carboxylase [Methanomassiliicoccales archaeon]
MRTQHPDNVNPPFLTHDIDLAGEDEIQEADHVFSHLDCDEQMREAHSDKGRDSSVASE